MAAVVFAVGPGTWAALLALPWAAGAWYGSVRAERRVERRPWVGGRRTARIALGLGSIALALASVTLLTPLR